MPLYLALAAPLVAAVGYLCLGWRRPTRWLGAVAAGLVLVAAVWQNVDYATAFGGRLRTQPLAPWTLLVVGAVATLALAGWPRQLANEVKDHILGPVTARWYGVSAMVALAAAVVASTASTARLSLAATAVLVVALTALIVSRRKPAQVRAAIGYGAAGLGGVAMATVGILLPQGTAATVVTLLGWAALAGLAPLHWWLPPTVSVASAPVSVLIAGVQVPVAIAGMLRLDSPPRSVLIGLALASLITAVAGLARQADLRRLIAYTGIAATGLAVAALGLGAVIVTRWLPLCLGLNAAALYLASGHVVSLTGSGRVATVRGLLSRSPLLGQVLGLGLFTATVLTFTIGFARTSAHADDPLGVLGLGLATGLAAITVLTATYGWRMLTGHPADRPDLTTGPARPLGSAAPVLIIAVAAAVVATIAP